jgi:hypothetical protein
MTKQLESLYNVVVYNLATQQRYTLENYSIEQIRRLPNHLRIEKTEKIKGDEYVAPLGIR